MIYGKISLHERDAYSLMVLPRNSQLTPGIYCKRCNSVAIVFQQLCKYAYNVINEKPATINYKIYMHQRGVKRVSAKTISVLTEENTSNDRILTCLIENVQ